MLVVYQCYCVYCLDSRATACIYWFYQHHQQHPSQKVGMHKMPHPLWQREKINLSSFLCPKQVHLAPLQSSALYKGVPHALWHVLSQSISSSTSPIAISLYPQPPLYTILSTCLLNFFLWCSPAPYFWPHLLSSTTTFTLVYFFINLFSFIFLTWQYNLIQTPPYNV